METLEKQHTLETRKEHQFYLSLVDFLDVVYGISHKDAEILKESSYLYFRAILTFDGIFDGDNSPSSFMEGLNQVENSVRQLSQLYSPDHPFWEDFDKYKALYFSTIAKEKQYSKINKTLSESEFDEIAYGKSAMCYAMVNAISYLSSLELSAKTQIDDAMLRVLSNIHIAFQCKDDVDDFKSDLVNGQHTYAHVLTYQSLEKESAFEEKQSAQFLWSYFFVSGQATRLLKKAIRHFNIAREITERYQLISMSAYIDHEIGNIHAQIGEINMLIDKTRSKAGQAHKAIHRSTLVSKDLMESSVALGLEYLSKSFDGEHLSDFMTGLGLGKHWVSNYAAFMLHGHSLAEGITARLKKPYLADVHGQYESSYNESVVTDADSTAFGMAARKLLHQDFTAKDFQKWQAFQNPEGGWRTYTDESGLRKQIKLNDEIGLNGWMSPHNCVSASTCDLLTLFPEMKDTYFKTAEYLSRQVDISGQLCSYWWTSPIYATSWMIAAFSRDEILKSECQSSLTWLRSQQLATGAWQDDFSEDPSGFYTALSLRALLLANPEQYQKDIDKALSFLLRNQMTDGSWKSGRILAIPQTDVADQRQVKKWRKSSFGVNVLVDDHRRVFTTITALNALLTKLRQL